MFTAPELTTGTNAYRATTEAPLRLLDAKRDAYVERTVVTSDGVRLAVRDHNPAGREHTVVLLHGLCLTQDSWAIQIRQLTHRWGSAVRIISYDHRGHGRSAGGPTHTYRVERLAADLADVLRTLRVTGPVTLAGHSLGGMTALAYLSRPAAQRPVEPENLVLIAAAAGRISERGLGRVLASPSARVVFDLATRMPHRTSERDGCLTSITAKTVVVSGGADITTPDAHARDLVAAIPGAIHLQQPAAGHMLLLDAPHYVTAAINRAMGLHRSPAWTAKTWAARHGLPGNAVAS